MSCEHHAGVPALGRGTVLPPQLSHGRHQHQQPLSLQQSVLVQLSPMPGPCTWQGLQSQCPLQPGQLPCSGLQDWDVKHPAHPWADSMLNVHPTIYQLQTVFLLIEYLYFSLKSVILSQIQGILDVRILTVRQEVHFISIKYCRISSSLSIFFLIVKKLFLKKKKSYLLFVTFVY